MIPIHSVHAILVKDNGLRILVELTTVEPLPILELSDELCITVIVVAMGVTFKEVDQVINVDRDLFVESNTVWHSHYNC